MNQELTPAEADAQPVTTPASTLIDWDMPQQQPADG